MNIHFSIIWIIFRFIVMRQNYEIGCCEKINKHQIVSILSGVLSAQKYFYWGAFEYMNGEEKRKLDVSTINFKLPFISFQKNFSTHTRIFSLDAVALGVTQTRIRSKLYSWITKAMVELVMMNISRRVVKIMVWNVINNILFMNIDE